jgi:hypothetical protein
LIPNHGWDIFKLSRGNKPNKQEEDMKGSQKQIEWAEKIKANIEAEAKQYRGRKEAYDKMIDFILSIDNASFWIDHRDYGFKTLMTDLYKGGLLIRGTEFSDCAKCDENGDITYGSKGIDGIFVSK